MFDTKHWNFSRKGEIEGKVVVLSDEIVTDATKIREAYDGPLIFLLPRRPSTEEIAQFPHNDCLVVSEEGETTSKEFLVATSEGIFYANGASGVIKRCRERGMVWIDFLAIKTQLYKKIDEEIIARANGLSATGDIGNGMSERQNFYFEVATQLSNDRSYERADRYFQKADELRANHPFTWNNRGGNFTRWGKLHDAESAFRHCLYIDPSNATAQKNLGDVLWKTNRIHAAKEHYKIALLHDGVYSAAWYGLGNVHLKLGDLATAEKCFRQALKFDPVDHLSFINLGAVLSMQGNLSDALDAYSEAKTLEPEYPELDVAIEALRSKLDNS